MATFNGNNSNNNLVGTNWGDAMFGNGGNDTISGGKGNDYLHGGLGVDRLYGGDGDDRMNLTTGTKAYSHTNTSKELLDGGAGIDNAHIDAKGSTVDGMATHTVNIGYSGPGDYWISLSSNAGYGNARIATAESVESFTLREDGPALNFLGNIGGIGPHLAVTATNKADFFTGGGENTTANLMGGDDTAIISSGTDIFTLGEGADTVKFTAWYNGARDGVVNDFNPDEDILDLAGWSDANPLTVTEENLGTRLSAGDDSLLLIGVYGYDSMNDFIA